MAIERSDWGPPAVGAGAGGRETPGNVPQESGGNPPSVDADNTDNIRIKGDAGGNPPPADGNALAGLDDEQISTCRGMLKHFSAEEVQRLHSLTDAEMAALQAPPVPKLSVSRELERIATLRRTDRRAYDKDHALQARELALLEQQAQAKEAGAKASAEPGDASAMPPETIAAWKAEGGVEFHLRVAQETASVAFLWVLDIDDQGRLFFRQPTAQELEEAVAKLVKTAPAEVIE